MRKGNPLVRAIVPTLLIGSGITYAGYVWSGYQKGQEEYALLNEAVLSSYSTGETDNTDMVCPVEEYGGSPPDDGRGGYETLEAENEAGLGETHIWKPLAAELPADAPQRMNVDWKMLLDSYPVLQAEDNDYYLHRDINREYLYAGSVFMDTFNNPSMFNYNTVIYGHNMRDGSMFARLKELQDPEMLEKCRYFWIYTPEADLLYEIFSVHPARSGSETFTVRFTDYKAYRSWQEKMKGLSVVPIESQLEYQDRIVTLSTCTESSSTRMTVQGKLVWKRDSINSG